MVNHPVHMQLAVHMQLVVTIGCVLSLLSYLFKSQL